MGQIHLRGMARVALFLALAATLVAADAECSEAQAEGPREAQAPGQWERHYHQRAALFEKENAAAKNIVMVGSSHIEGLDANKLLPGRRVVNRGIAADRIGITERGILHRLKSSIFDCNPGFVILENGVNDLGELWRHGTPTIDETEACYREVVQRIRTRLPDVPLLIVGLFPTRDRYAELNPMIVEFNRRLVRIAADFDCPFLDVYAPFADADGLLRQEYSREGLHLTVAGYRHWAKLIAAVLSRYDSPSPPQPAPG